MEEPKQRWVKKSKKELRLLVTEDIGWIGSDRGEFVLRRRTWRHVKTRITTIVTVIILVQVAMRFPRVPWTFGRRWSKRGLSNFVLSLPGRARKTDVPDVIPLRIVDGRGMKKNLRREHRRAEPCRDEDDSRRDGTCGVEDFRPEHNTLRRGRDGNNNNDRMPFNARWPERVRCTLARRPKAYDKRTPSTAIV